MVDPCRVIMRFPLKDARQASTPGGRLLRFLISFAFLLAQLVVLVHTMRGSK